jgi:hypothetical protein
MPTDCKGGKMRFIAGITIVAFITHAHCTRGDDKNQKAKTDEFTER